MKLNLNTTALINMAQVCQMHAGNFDVTIDLPDYGTCLVQLCERPDGYGGTVCDVMRVDAIDECVAKRTLKGDQLERVRALISDAERKTNDHGAVEMIRTRIKEIRAGSNIEYPADTEIAKKLARVLDEDALDRLDTDYRECLALELEDILRKVFGVTP